MSITTNQIKTHKSLIMKKFLSFAIATLAVFIAVDSFAQFNQGRYIAGGGFNFSTETNKSKSGSTVTTDGKSTQFSLSPQVGYFPVDNIAVGLGLVLSSGKYKPDGVGTTSTSSSVSVGPFVRYYLPVPVFFQAMATFGSTKAHFDYPDPIPDADNSYGIFNWSLGVGYAYFLNDYVAIEPMVGFRNDKLSDKDSDYASIDSSIYLNAAFTIYLGERQ